jgi:tetratricopeptide (TPR) repeat protein
VPKIKVGDQVTVVGTFALRSPHSESNSDGLIVYASLTHDRPGAAKEVPAPTPPSTVSAATPATAPAPARIERGTLDAAERSYRACQEAIASNRLEDAAAACRAATETWPGHHAAWWTLGMIHAKSGDLSSAADEFQRAATLDPEAAMYQMWLGIALYERARIAARDDLAARTGQPASDGMIDLSGVDLDAALATLLLAAQLEPRLFRAHYYIGRIHRDHDRARQAAEAFTAAIAADPFRGVSFVALAQLYESWGYLQEAIEVAEAGARSVPGARERSDVWTVLGRVYDAHGEPDRALDALENALDAWPDNATARFERGQARFRRKDYAGAKEDLTIYATSGAYRDGFNRVLTNKMLLESAAELAGQER